MGGVRLPCRQPRPTFAACLSLHQPLTPLQPPQVLMDRSTLEKFAKCFTVIKIPEKGTVQQGPTSDFLIVGEGQVDVSVKVPSTNKKTGFVREVLTSKKQVSCPPAPRCQPNPEE